MGTSLPPKDKVLPKTPSTKLLSIFRELPNSYISLTMFQYTWFRCYSKTVHSEKEGKAIRSTKSAKRQGKQVGEGRSQASWKREEPGELEKGRVKHVS